MPFLVTNEGVVTKNLKEKIVFQFMKKPILKDLNLVQIKEKQINFLSKEVYFKRIEQNLASPTV